MSPAPERLRLRTLVDLDDRPGADEPRGRPEVDRAFLEYYEDELAHIRALASEFAELHPAVAREPVARHRALPRPLRRAPARGRAPILAARTRLKLDGEGARFARAVLDALYPDLIAPTPAVGMAVLQPGQQVQTMLAGHVGAARHSARRRAAPRPLDAAPPTRRPRTSRSGRSRSPPSPTTRTAARSPPPASAASAARRDRRRSGVTLAPHRRRRARRARARPAGPGLRQPAPEGGAFDVLFGAVGGDRRAPCASGELADSGERAGPGRARRRRGADAVVAAPAALRVIWPLRADFYDAGAVPPCARGGVAGARIGGVLSRARWSCCSGRAGLVLELADINAGLTRSPSLHAGRGPHRARSATSSKIEPRRPGGGRSCTSTVPGPRDFEIYLVTGVWDGERGRPEASTPSPFSFAQDRGLARPGRPSAARACRARTAAGGLAGCVPATRWRRSGPRRSFLPPAGGRTAARSACRGYARSATTRDSCPLSPPRSGRGRWRAGDLVQAATLLARSARAASGVAGGAAGLAGAARLVPTISAWRLVARLSFHDLGLAVEGGVRASSRSARATSISTPTWRPCARPPRRARSNDGAPHARWSSGLPIPWLLGFGRGTEVTLEIDEAGSGPAQTAPGCWRSWRGSLRATWLSDAFAADLQIKPSL